LAARFAPFEKVECVVFVAPIAAFIFALLAAPPTGPAAPTAPPAAQDTGNDKEIVVIAERQKKLWLESLEAFRAGRYAEAEEKTFSLEQSVENEARFAILNLSIFTSDFIFTVDRVPDAAAAIVYVRGIAQARQGKLDAAAGAMKESLRIDPKFFDAYVDLALIEVLRKRPDRARRQLKPMEKLLAKCDYNCEEKQVRYQRVQQAAQSGAEAATN